MSKSEVLTPGQHTPEEHKAKKSHSKLSIRRASFEDMPLVASFISSSADWYEKIVDEKDIGEHNPGQKWIEKNFPKREFYIGYDGDTPVGTISMQEMGGYTYLGYIFLDVKFVGKRFGHQLVDFAKRKSVSLDRKGMVLIAHPEASWSIKAYEKLGFERIANQRKEVLGWNGGALKTYYEEGFELYRHPL